MNKTFCKSPDGDAGRILWSGNANPCPKYVFIPVTKNKITAFMKVPTVIFPLDGWLILSEMVPC